jgi:hypothetical protein
MKIDCNPIADSDMTALGYERLPIGTIVQKGDRVGMIMSDHSWKWWLAGPALVGKPVTGAESIKRQTKPAIA